MTNSHRTIVPPLVSDSRELVALLAYVGSVKLKLPRSIRGIFNSTGLYVQIQNLPRYEGNIKNIEWVLKAGGKFRSYFEARSIGFEEWMAASGDDSTKAMLVSMIAPEDWNIYRLNHDVWERRFAHVVWPTYEIAARLDWLNDQGLADDPTETSRISEIAEHLKRTREWRGVADIRCHSCGAHLWIWEYEDHDVCPNCGTPHETKNPALGLGTEEAQSDAKAAGATPTKTRAVRLESIAGCPRCPINPAEPFDFLNDEAAHSLEFNHELIWEGSVEVPDVFDIAGIRETCAVFIQAMLAVKPMTQPNTTYRIGIERREISDEERRLLGIPSDSDRIQYRCFTGGAAGIANEIGRFLQNHKCEISEAQLQQAREGLIGNDLKFFNIAVTTSKM